MSSGLPPIIPSASQQTSTQPFSGNPFPHFGYLFGPNQSTVLPNPFNLGQSSNSNSNQQNRFKIKRHRQRVDAGEPRNVYQGVKSRSQAAPSQSQSSQQSSQITPIIHPHQLTEMLQPLWNTQTIANLNNEEVEETRSVREEIESSAEETAKSGQETEEEDEEEDEEEESVKNKADSPNSTSSASKRKSFQPKKIEEQLGIEEEPEQINIAVGGSSTPEQEDNDNETTDDSSDDKPIEQSAIQAQLNTPALSLLEAQKRMYSLFLEQQKNRLIGLQQNKKEMNMEQLVESLKSELIDNLQNVMKEPSSSTPKPKIMTPHPIFHHPMFAAAAAAAAAANGTHNNPLFPSPPQAAIGGGIFPPAFNAFQQMQAFNALRRNMENEEPRKKRIKLENDSASSASTPPRYFPPTMVGHPMYGNLAFANLNLAAAAAAANMTDRENSPTNSDDMNDFGMYDGCGNSTLTPMHLRKAKLMFFYTRYPNSNLLKSYFPDIRFNKNNTAQLVKWFSNFREFYYIQMEKFGRQLLADGIRSRDEIFVNKDSELFKVLNTHYNRNNHIKAPDNLLYVVQETLREFYDAIRLGKDSEPSWKKTIYKIINRMDDQIPEFFKEPNFLDRLEG